VSLSNENNDLESVFELGSFFLVHQRCLIRKTKKFVFRRNDEVDDL
jgi:hypothetical protein